jgi:hypothetical protein
MEWVYDGQIRRYITQMIRMFSNFYYKTGNGTLIQVPVMYGDMSRQVASIIKENSENKLPSVPRIALYITNIELDRDRISDSSFVSKTQIRERAYDTVNKKYSNKQGKNYTIERLMPTPYKLTVNADVWTSNTDQKLQLFEQIAVFFSPSIEIQTTDNFVDWASLTVVDLENIIYSSRTIPVGTESEIDILTFTLKTPIWISPPAKVKKMGIITNIITSIFNEEKGIIDLSLSMPELNAYDNSSAGRIDSENGTLTETLYDSQVVATNYQQFGVFVKNKTAKLAKNNSSAKENWWDVLTVHPGKYIANSSKIFLTRLDLDISIVGTFVFNNLDNSIINVTWDTDTFPADTIIEGKTNIDYVIDPRRFNPTSVKIPGVRLLIVDDVGDTAAADGPVAWKQSTGDDFYASANDIIEWTGSAWRIVFDSSNAPSQKVFVTNLNTKIQYVWTGTEWTESINGYYPPGSWRLELD